MTPAWRSLACFVLGCLLLAPGPLAGRTGDYRLEIRVSQQDGFRAFEWEVLLERREFRKIEFQPRKALKGYFLEAHKALAREQGYHEKIYGKDYYKYVKVENMLYEIYDLRSRRVVLKGRR